MNNDFTLHYQAVPESGCHPDIGKYRTYGIQVIPQSFIHDVSTDGATVERMANLFTEHQLSPLHLFDVVEDMLP